MVKKSFADKSRTKAAGKPRGSKTEPPAPKLSVKAKRQELVKANASRKAIAKAKDKRQLIIITKSQVSPLIVMVNGRASAPLRVGIPQLVTPEVVDALKVSDATFEELGK